MDPLPRVYSEKEAAEILRRAARLQELGNIEGEINGISQTELERIAAECGIDASHLQRAIAEGSTSFSAKGFLRLVQEHERTLEGELTQEGVEMVVAELAEHHAGRQFAQQLGRTLTVRFANNNWLSVVSRNGRTKIQLRSGVFVPFMAGLYPGLITAFVLGVNLAARGMWLWALVSSVLLLAAGSVAFWLLLGHSHRRYKELLERVVASMVRPGMMEDPRSRPDQRGPFEP